MMINRSAQLELALVRVRLLGHKSAHVANGVFVAANAHGVWRGIGCRRLDVLVVLHLQCQQHMIIAIMSSNQSKFSAYTK